MDYAFSRVDAVLRGSLGQELFGLTIQLGSQLFTRICLAPHWRAPESRTHECEVYPGLGESFPDDFVFDLIQRPDLPTYLGQPFLPRAPSAAEAQGFVDVSYGFPLPVAIDELDGGGIVGVDPEDETLRLFQSGWLRVRKGVQLPVEIGAPGESVIVHQTLRRHVIPEQTVEDRMVEGLGILGPEGRAGKDN